MSIARNSVPDEPSSHTVADATVIIPAHDAAATLEQCLQSVFASEGVALEVIVVDDASTDATRRIARRFPCRLIEVRSNIWAANCRNLGARHAGADTLVFFDADQLMREDTVRQYVQALRDDPDVDAVVGSLAPDTPTPGFFSKLKNFQHHFTHQTAEREGSTLDSGRMAIRRHVFDELGGFEPAFAGASIEDIALGYLMSRRGRRIRFEPTIQVVHLKGYTLGQMIRSDIVDRAIPWTGLMLRERTFHNDLNTRTGNIASVALAWWGAAGAVAGLAGRNWGWPAVLVAVSVTWILNRGFLAAADRRLGARFTLGAALFLPVMYLYQGVGLVAGLVAYATGASVAHRRDPPDPDYRIVEPGHSCEQEH